MEVVWANGLEIAYERVGEGPPVHGAEDGRVWRPEFAALANESTVVAWDEPGATARPRGFEPLTFGSVEDGFGTLPLRMPRAVDPAPSEVPVAFTPRGIVGRACNSSPPPPPPMQLSSVLELQDQLLRSAGPGTGLAAQSAREGTPARRSRELASVQPALALGVTAARGDDFRLAFRVQRRALVASSKVQAIVDAAHGEVDVRYIGRVEKLQDRTGMRERHRPLIAGASVGHVAITAGTLGAFVTTAGGELAILSNNHVLADENRAEIGDAVIQPADLDDGTDPDDVVARLTEYVPIAPGAINRVDAAVATLVDGLDVDPVGTLGTLDDGIVAPQDADRVEKLGRTTGRTTGRVSAFNVRSVIVEYDVSSTVRFDGQIEIQTEDGDEFSLGGDSGSLIVSAGDRVPVGLLFAGSDQGGLDGGPVTYANPIDEVLAALNVDLYRGS